MLYVVETKLNLAEASRCPFMGIGHSHVDVNIKRQKSSFVQWHQESSSQSAALSLKISSQNHAMHDALRVNPAASVM